ncbi:hypothetical protein KHS38_00230 [Mucilaginibacter sp. Bleaf8]|uniref:hypothetical protein n=1 Tax=Mucilaginibacter sp. Bleaf8 TaxID=2834430 RepID=UPI001BD19453|nr:hypothetical protein [Mucilaginibacter sp. Bleaf8]MBS7562816.1 hypothetical protein [Mucilaginibacter sp. Bleaf8]
MSYVETLYLQIRMSVFRKNILTSLISIILLSVFAFKTGAPFIHHLSKAETDPISVEKNTEDGKDTKEDLFDKSEKKIFSCDYYTDLHVPLEMISDMESKFSCDSHPPVQAPHRTVPTPPPDFLV